MKDNKLIHQISKVKFYNEESEIFYIKQLKNILSKELSKQQIEILDTICNSYIKLYEMQKCNLKNYFIEILKNLD